MGEVGAADGEVVAADGEVVAADGEVGAADGEVGAADGEVGAADGEGRVARGQVWCREGRGCSVGVAQRRGHGPLTNLSTLAGPGSAPTKFSTFSSQSKRDRKKI